MTAVALPARVAYTAGAVPLGWAAGFYSCMRILPEFTPRHPQLDPNFDGSGIFRIAICAGGAIALSLGLVTLTLPWIRHRKKVGRPARIVFSSVLVVLGSLFFADLGFRLVYDLVFAAWLTYLLAFTLVRYGVIDQSRRVSNRERYKRRIRS